MIPLGEEPQRLVLIAVGDVVSLYVSRQFDEVDEGASGVRGESRSECPRKTLFEVRPTAVIEVNARDAHRRQRMDGHLLLAETLRDRKRALRAFECRLIVKAPAHATLREGGIRPRELGAYGLHRLQEVDGDLGCVHGAVRHAGEPEHLG